MQFGIRLHDVNASLPASEQALESRARKAREEGFSCVHLALAKCIPGVTFDNAALTEGLAAYVRRVFQREELDVAVLGCYLNLAHPDPAKVSEFQSRYFGSLRVASQAGIGMVGMWNLEPVVEYAEKFGAIIAIEPVWNHIVFDAERALMVLRAIQSPNLRIIFDPVNLLAPENLDQREQVLGDAMDKLCDDIAMVHLKDYVRADGKLVSVAAGTGEMDYTEIMRFLKARKPFIQASLENTSNDNAVRAREFLEEAYASV